MAQQQRFVTRPLPDELQASIGRDADDALVALRRLAEFVMIKKHESALVGVASPAVALVRARGCAFDDRQRIAAAGLKEDGIEMNGKACLIDETRQECCIALFALAFAAHEYPPALGYQSAAHLHPI